jgi:hypothetical protein
MELKETIAKVGKFSLYILYFITIINNNIQSSPLAS